jgi:hypothetical protein
LYLDVETQPTHVGSYARGNLSLSGCTSNERWIDRVNGDEIAQERYAGIHHCRR